MMINFLKQNKRIATRFLTGLVLCLGMTGTSAAPGELDPAFDPGVGPNDRVFGVDVQGDGKIMVGGNFRNYRSTVRNRVARLNSDGSLDTTFDPGTGANDSVYAVSVQSDGSIVVGGKFTQFGNQVRGRIVRMSATGQLDSTFNSGGSGFNNIVEKILPLSSGKLLVMGAFTSFNGAAASRIIRLNADGTRDATFNVGAGANNIVRDAVELPDGKLVVVGSFTSFAGRSYLRVVRLNTDGSVDLSFTNPAATGEVYAVALQNDGGVQKLVIGGGFARLGPTSHLSVRLGRLNLDGTVDTTFSNPGFNNTVRDIAIQSNNGNVIAVGSFTSMTGQSVSRVVRLTADGVYDSTFTIGSAANSTVRAVDLDDWILVGDFTSYNGTTRSRIVRLNNDVPVPTVITTQPVATTTVAGGTATFTVVASGVLPLNYQWYGNGVALSDGGDISGATTASLTIGNAENADAVGYHVVVTAAGGAGDAVTSDTALLTVNPNVAPTIAAIANQTVLEDSTGNVVNLTGISEGPAYESAQTVSISATSSDTAIVPHPTVTYTDGQSTATLAVTPVTSAVGTVTITVTVTDSGLDNRTTTATFELTVGPVNDAPTLSNVPVSLNAIEDIASVISGVTANDIDTPTLEMTVSVLNGTVQLTGQIPAGITQVDSDGSDGTIVFTGPIASINAALSASIQYQGAANYNGSDTMTITVNDRDPVDPKSATANITIVVAPVNDAPTVTLASANVGAPSGGGAQVVANFASFNPGPAGEAGQTLVGYTVAAATPGFFSVLPAIDGNGQLTFTPSGANGSSVVTVTAQDSGGTDRGGVDTSAPVQFTVSVAENQPPTINPIANQSVPENSGQQTITLTGISEGTPFESAQTLSITAESNIPGIVGHPTVTHVEDAATATLSFTPVPGVFGTARITVTLTDNGPSNRTTTTTFDIIVTPFNDPPVLANLPAARTVNEDTQLGISGVTVDDPDDHSLRVTVSAPNGIVGLTPANPPNIIFLDGDGSDGTLVFTGTLANLNSALASSISYQGQADYHGPDTLTVRIEDLDEDDAKSAQSTTAITVNSVNDAPTVTLSQSGFNHDAGTATGQNVAGFAGFSPGPANESSQSLISYTVIVSDASIFAVVPSINNSGVLSYTPNGNAGQATVTVTARDDGGVANGGVDTSAGVTFTIGVDIANAVPVVVIDPAKLNVPGGLSVAEDAPAQVISGFLSALTPGVGEEATQNIAQIDVTNDNNPLFASQPALTGDGTTLEYTLAADASGSATVTVRVIDDGPTINGQAIATTVTFTITATPVNDPPSLIQGGDITVNEDAGAQTFAAWATGVTSGAHNESDTVSINVVATDTSLFATQPTVDLLTGDLTFASAPDAHGTTVVTITLSDDGAGDAPNDNSTDITFNITFNPVNDRPVVDMAANGGGELVRNGDFETGAFTNWNLIKDNPGFPGQQTDWEVISPGINGSHRARARSDQAFGTQIMYQDVTIPDSAAASFSFQIAYVATDDWIVGNSLYTKTVPAEPGEVNQQIRVDVVKPTTGHFSTATSDILATAFVTHPGDPTTLAPQKVSLDLTQFGGQTVRLRFAVAVSQAPVEVFVDDVSVETFGQLLGATAIDGAGQQTVADFATITSYGAVNENAQSGTYTVLSNSNPGMFDVVPAIDANGTLTYTPRAGVRGSAIISFSFTDDGGTANGGNDTSEVQTFFISVGGARVYVDGNPGISGDSVSIEIDLDSSGNENSVGFTFLYDPLALVFDTAVVGADAGGATVFTNGDNPGSLGLVVALPTGQSFPAGNRHVLTLNFNRAPTSPTTGRSPLGFGDSPVLRQVTSADATILDNVIFVGAELILSETLEGDVAPRPFGSGSVTVADGTQVARFVVGLDVPNNGSEFQRTDTAPLGTSGDGILSVADWVQTLRFAAALDTPGAVGGPNEPVNPLSPNSLRRSGTATRQISLQSGVLVPGQTATVRMVMNATGVEAGVSCSVTFDPAVLSYTGSRTGSGAAGAMLIVNSQQAANGTLGIVLGLPAGSTIAAGEQVLVEIDFSVGGSTPTTAINLGNSPVVEEVTDSLARRLPATFAGGVFPVQLPAGFKPVGVSSVDGALRFVFGNEDGSPVTADQLANLHVYVSDSIVATTWQRLDNALVIVGGQVQIVDPGSSGGIRFYRVIRSSGSQTQ